MYVLGAANEFPDVCVNQLLIFCVLQPDSCKLAKQFEGPLLPIKQPQKLIAFRAITEDEKKYSVFEAMRKARADARLVGVREKRARQKAEEEKQAKKPGK